MKSLIVVVEHIFGRGASRNSFDYLGSGSVKVQHDFGTVINNKLSVYWDLIIVNMENWK